MCSSTQVCSNRSACKHTLVGKFSQEHGRRFSTSHFSRPGQMQRGEKKEMLLSRGNPALQTTVATKQGSFKETVQELAVILTFGPNKLDQTPSSTGVLKTVFLA